jgi:hypothetical protein
MPLVERRSWSLDSSSFVVRLVLIFLSNQPCQYTDMMLNAEAV